MSWFFKKVWYTEFVTNEALLSSVCIFFRVNLCLGKVGFRKCGIESNKERTPKGPRMGPPGGGPGMGAGEKAKDFKTAIKRLFSELKGFRKLIMVALVLAIFSAVLSISAPDKLSELTNKISEGLMPPFFMDIARIRDITIILVVLYVVSALFNFIQSICMTTVANKFA